MAKLDKYEDILRVVSSTGGFYNPNKEDNKIGEFYLKVNGVPKTIEISYKGNISLFKNNKFPKKILMSNNSQKGLILLSSIQPCEYPSEKLFKFSGGIDVINYVKIYNWAGAHIYSSVNNYDQTYIPLNSSKTNFEDDSILIKDIKVVKKTHRSVTKRRKIIAAPYDIKKEEAQLRLPESYVSRTQTENQHCHNCYFFKGFNHCEKWDAKVSPHGWCASWKKKGVK